MAVSELKLIKHSVEHLERDLDNIKKIPKRTRGIYVLYKIRPNKLKPKGDAYDVVYIGMAGGVKKAGIGGRLRSHLINNKSIKWFINFTV